MHTQPHESSLIIELTILENQSHMLLVPLHCSRVISISPLAAYTESLSLLASMFLMAPLSSSLWCPASDFPNCVFHQRITAGKHHTNEFVTAECPQTCPQRSLLIASLTVCYLRELDEACYIE